MTEIPPPPIVLVGIMGAGKSSAGRLLAARCGRRFLDLDVEIERRAGRSVERLFSGRGEDGFRDLEAEASRALAVGAAAPPGLVIAAGGGWMANPAARAALPDAVTVWLKVGPSEAARRLAPEPGGRPLLSGGDVEARLADLLAERLPAYGQATYTVETQGRSPAEVASVIAGLAGLSPEDDETHYED